MLGGTRRPASRAIHCASLPTPSMSKWPTGEDQVADSVALVLGQQVRARARELLLEGRGDGLLDDHDTLSLVQRIELSNALLSTIRLAAAATSAVSST